MAWAIEHDAAAYTIHQSGTRFRRIFVAVVACALAADAALAFARIGDPFRLSFAVAGGALVVAFALRNLSYEIDARFDRAGNRVTIRGRRWFDPRCELDAPLEQIQEIGRGFYGTGRRWYFMYALMTDGPVTLWMPARGAGEPEVAARVKELTEWIAAARTGK
jgi:hypothetical protein